MKVAALDLGTNSFLCLIAEVKKDSLQALSDEMEIVRLGQDLQKSGRLHAEALARAKECLQKFKTKIVQHHVDRIKAVATSAARDAQNREELIRILDDLDIPLEIISGDREAELTFKGAMQGLAAENHLVIDIGGGSTEFLYQAAARSDSLVGRSLDIGGVRLSENYHLQDQVLAQNLNEARKHILREFQSLNLPRDKDWIAVAGTPTALVAIKKNLKVFEENKIHGEYLSQQDLTKIFERLQVPLQERKQIPGLDPKRADIIVAATLILLTAMSFYDIPQIMVSTKGVRYGLAQELWGQK